MGHYLDYYRTPAINGWDNCWAIDQSTLYAKHTAIEALSSLSTQPEQSRATLPSVFYIAIVKKAETALHRPTPRCRPIHIFDKKSFQALDNLIPSASDLLLWLWFREQNTGSDSNLWQILLESSLFYQRAWQVEKQLQKLDYLSRISDPIKASIYKKQDSIIALKKRLLDCSPLYHRLISRYLEQNPDPTLAKLLYLQSLYTQMKIVEFIVSYGTLTDEQKRQGVIAHEHAYHRLGQHFVLVIYGQDDDELNPNFFEVNHRHIIAHFLAELKPKGVTTLTVLAFDLSKKTPNGDIDVNMHVFY